MRKLFIGFLVSSFLLFFMESCKRNPDPSSDSDILTPFDKAYYEQLGNNTRRLQILKTGLFAQYIMNEDSSLTAWTHSGDSVYLYTIPVGEPNKNGHWVMITQFLSGLPDEPLSIWFEKIERISRDTFGVWSMPWNDELVGYKELARNGIDLKERGIELPNKVSGEPRSIYFREGPAHFRELPIPRSVSAKFAERNVSYQKVFVDLQPQGSYFQAHYFDKDSVLMGKGATNALLRKTKEEEARVAGFYDE